MEKEGGQTGRGRQEPGPPPAVVYVGGVFPAPCPGRTDMQERNLRSCTRGRGPCGQGSHVESSDCPSRVGLREALLAGEDPEEAGCPEDPAGWRRSLW